MTRLRKDGLVETRWLESKAGPPRRYYRVTASGRAALAAFKQEWRVFRDAVDAVVGEAGARGAG